MCDIITTTEHKIAVKGELVVYPLTATVLYENLYGPFSDPMGMWIPCPICGKESFLSTGVLCGMLRLAYKGLLKEEARIGYIHDPVCKMRLEQYIADGFELVGEILLPSSHKCERNKKRRKYVTIKMWEMLGLTCTLCGEPLTGAQARNWAKNNDLTYFQLENNLKYYKRLPKFCSHEHAYIWREEKKGVIPRRHL